MKLLRRETNTYMVRDEQGKEDEVVEFAPTVPVTLYTNNFIAGSSSSQISIPEYELKSDGSCLIKIGDAEFQTAAGLVPRRFFIVCFE